MSQTKTPPWERNDLRALTGLERGLLVHIQYDWDKEEWWKHGWSELCALQAVAEAAEAWDSDALQAPQLRFALREWRAICPK